MPTTPKEFHDMGKKMSNCVAGYYEMVAQGRSIIVFVYDRHTNEPIINIEIRPKGNNEYYISQFLGKQNSLMIYREYEAYYKAYLKHVLTIKPE
jgi:hypothetical protein